MKFAPKHNTRAWRQVRAKHLSHVGGIRINPEMRNEIVELYLRDPEAATQRAAALGLRHDYAYRVTYERGLLPRTSKYWGKLTEGKGEGKGEGKWPEAEPEQSMGEAC